MTYRHFGCFATLLFALVAPTAKAESVSVDNATKEQLAAATDYYERGIVAMDEGKVDEALDLFRKSCEQVDSPNSHMMLGRALSKLGRLPEAYQELSLSIEQAANPSTTQKKYKKTAESAQHELSAILPKLAFVAVKPGATVQIRGQTAHLTSSQKALPVTPGVVTFDITFADGRSASTELTLKAGEHRELRIPDPPAAHAQNSQPVSLPSPATTSAESARSSGFSRKTVGYIFGAVGIAGVGAFVGFGILGASQYGTPKNSCVSQVCSQIALNNEGSKGLYQGIGYAGLGIGVVGLAAGSWLLLSSDPGDSHATALRVAPNGFQLAGTF